MPKLRHKDECPYCHLCGQSLFVGKENCIEKFFSNALSLYSVDFKIFRTIKLLLFCPGKLTKEYCQGHIIRYEPPFKLFWTVSLLFFIYFSYKFDPNSTKLTGDIEFNRLFMNYLPYANLLLIPFFFFLFSLFYFLLSVFFSKIRTKIFKSHGICFTFSYFSIYIFRRSTVHFQLRNFYKMVAFAFNPIYLLNDRRLFIL